MQPAEQAVGQRNRSDVDVDFFLFQFKTQPCNQNAREHSWNSCPFFHVCGGVVEKARRRDPRVFSYVAESCWEFQKNGVCPQGDACIRAHGVFETWLHPTKFCTVMCTEGQACRRKVCWFAHSPGELRAPTPALAAAKFAQPPAAAAAAAAAASAVQPGAGSFQQLQQGAGCFTAAGVTAADEVPARPFVLCDPAVSPSSAGSSPCSSLSASLYCSSSTSAAISTTASSSRSSSTSHPQHSNTSPLTAGSSPQAWLPGADSLWAYPSQLLTQHNPLGGSSTGGSVGMETPQPQLGKGAGACGKLLQPGAGGAYGSSMSPSDGLVQQLRQLQQQLQQQQEAVPLLPGALQPQPGAWSSMGSSCPSGSVPVSIMHMLPANVAAGDSSGLLGGGSSSLGNPLSGLLSSLEQQAVQAQLQAASAQAAAAAANNNLHAVLSALGGVPTSQPAAAGVGVDSPSAVLLQQQQGRLLAGPPPLDGAGLYSWSTCWLS